MTRAKAHHKIRHAFLFVFILTFLRKFLTKNKNIKKQNFIKNLKNEKIF